MVREKWLELEAVVSIGAFLTFYVVFAPLEYIPTIPPLSSFVINIFCTFQMERGSAKYSLRLSHCAGQVNP